MPTKIKSTDSLPQWATKYNDLVETVNDLSQTGGLFESTTPAAGDFLVYDSGYKNKGLTGPITFNSSFGATGPDIALQVNTVFITDLVEIDSPTASDYMLIYDASAGSLKKISASDISTPPGGSDTYVQFNDGGTLGGDSGLVYNKTNDTLTIGGGLVVDTDTLVVDNANNRVGINTTTPGYALDVVGSANVSTGNTYRINGTSVISATTLGSTVVNSSLTSLGIISALQAGTGNFSSTLTANSLSITSSASIGTTLSVTGTSTLGVVNTGNLGVTGTINASSTITGTTITGSTLTSSGAVNGASASISGAAAVGSLTINSKSLSLSGNTTIGSSTHTVTFATTGNTSVTLPTSGTLLSSTVTSLPSLTTTGVLSNLQTSSLGVGTAASGTTGEIRATNNITAFYSSDRRLKENVKPIESALEKMDEISGVSFDWTEDFIKQHGGEDGYFIRKHDVGVIAQEVQTVLPEVVVQREDGTLAVKYDRIIPLLIQAIKELKQEVEDLKASR